jgi:hypothetical protein
MNQIVNINKVPDWLKQSQFYKNIDVDKNADFTDATSYTKLDIS